MLLQKFGRNQLKILVWAIIFPSFSICKIYRDDTYLLLQLSNTFTRSTSKTNLRLKGDMIQETSHQYVLVLQYKGYCNVDIEKLVAHFSLHCSCREMTSNKSTFFCWETSNKSLHLSVVLSFVGAAYLLKFD